VPPRDGDDISAGSDDELVAQIIPLRQREQDSVYPPRVLEPVDDPPPLGERSVWDQPTTELRRATRRASVPSSSSRVVGIAARISWRRVVPAVAVVLGGTLLALALVATLDGGSGRAIRPAAPSKAGATTIAHATGTLTARSPARRASQRRPAISDHEHQLRARERQRAREPQPSDVQSAGSGLAVASSGAGTSASYRPRSAAESSAAEFTPEARDSESGHPPSTSESQCVPGELGC
jgi:hypothetical protein